MVRRSLLTSSNCQDIFGISDDPEHLVRYYTLGREDHALIRTRRRDENRLGLALHIALLRHPGQGWVEGTEMPERFVAWLAEQLSVPNAGLADYAVRRKTRSEHHQLAMRHLELAPFEVTHFEAARVLPLDQHLVRITEPVS